MCISKSKTSEKECKVDELKNSIIEDVYNSTIGTPQESNSKKECDSTDMSPQSRPNKPKFTRSKIPLIVINKESNDKISCKEPPLLFANPMKINNKQSMSTDTMENNLMVSFTKSSVKSPLEFDFHDRKLDNNEKNYLFRLDSLKEEVV